MEQMSATKRTISLEFTDHDDGPTYRAMAIGDYLGETVVRSMSLGMQNVQLRDNSRTKPQIKKVETQFSGFDSVDEPKVEFGSKHTNLVARSNWKLDDASLPAIPSYYPMEKTSHFVPADTASPTVIAALVSDACVKMSVFAQYNGEKGMALCTSADFIEFYVFLFKTSAENDGRGDGTVVEVQRRKGCTLSFHRYARKILSAVRGEKDVDFEEVSPCVAPINCDKILGNVCECLVTERKYTLDALEIAGNLLTKERFDANILGMESLCLLTDSKRSGTLTSALVSRVILCDTMRPTDGSTPAKEGVTEQTNLDEEAFLIQSLDIRSRILSLIQCRKLSQHDEDEEEDFELMSHQEALGDDHVSQMHYLALAALSNALTNIAKDGALGVTCSQQPWLNGTELVSTLIGVLKQAESRPHEAVLSARCLGNLVQASMEATERAFKMDALSVVEAAKRVGQSHHAALERETGGLQKQLSCRAVNA